MITPAASEEWLQTGATIVTHEGNVAFFKRIYAKPTRVDPDALAKSGKRAKFVGVGDKHSMTDGDRTFELYRLLGNRHNGGLLIGYLPKEKIMMVADAYSGRRVFEGPAKKVRHNAANLWENLQRLNLDIESCYPSMEVRGKSNRSASPQDRNRSPKRYA